MSACLSDVEGDGGSAADLSDEILRAIADGKIFAMCRGVKVDADVVEAARVELDRRGAAVGE